MHVFIVIVCIIILRVGRKSNARFSLPNAHAYTRYTIRAQDERRGEWRLEDKDIIIQSDYDVCVLNHEL